MSEALTKEEKEQIAAMGERLFGVITDSEYTLNAGDRLQCALRYVVDLCQVSKMTSSDLVTIFADAVESAYDGVRVSPVVMAAGGQKS